MLASGSCVVKRRSQVDHASFDTDLAHKIRSTLKSDR
jgi:hypothetical protein